MAAKEPDLLARIFTDLRSKSEDVRSKAVKELRFHVSTVSRELSGENFTKFINDVNRRIFELVNGSDSTSDKIGGIMAIDQLIDIDGEDNTAKITRFANYLRIVLPGSDPQVSELAARAIGRLARAGGTLTAEFVEFEIKRALEWLPAQDRHEARRHASVLVLREIAQNAPTLFYPYANQFFEHIWHAMRDPKIAIREGASEAVRASLELISPRESQLRQQWYQKIYDEIQKGLKNGSIESVHGSLLALSELLTQTGTFLDPKYAEVCETVLKLKDHKEAIVRRAVVTLIPLLARFKPNDFSATYLNQSMVHLLAQLKKDKERGPAFTAIGMTAIEMQEHMNPYIDQILGSIREALGQRRGKAPSEPSVFVCISMLARALGQLLTKHMYQLLEPMFATGLSQPLTDALVDLSKHIPSLLSNIQEKLLDILSMTLSGQPFKHPGAPQLTRVSSNTSMSAREVQSGELRDAETITLALKTLGTFDFTGYSLNEFVRECVVSYLEDDNSEVRKSAAQTCCQLLAKQPDPSKTNMPSSLIVGEVLEKLLTVGITDPDPSIRQTVLSSLDERFDRYLAQAENVRSLFVALNDEVFSIRELSISIIGRLTTHNPAYVMPSLRKTLIQLLSELEYSTVSRNKEESAMLLGKLMASSRTLIKPYAEPILKAILPKLRDPSPGVAARVMFSLGELAQVSGPDIGKYMDDLMTVIIETLQDQSSVTKREAALSTLGKLVIATGYVIDPYSKYPNLLNMVLNFLKTEQQMSIRREAVKLLGILGALDPYRHKINQSTMRTGDKDSNNNEDDIDHILIGMSTSSEDYHPTVVIHALMKILRDPSLSTHHTAVIQAIMFIFKTLGLKCVPFLPQIMPPFLNMMHSCQQNMIEFHFNKLSLLVAIVKQHIRNYLEDIFALIKEYWATNQTTIISLIKSIAVALDGEFKIYLPQLLPLLLQVFETDESDKRSPTLEVLAAFKKFGATLEEYLHLVIPMIVRVFERSDTPSNVRKTAIQTIGQLCKKLNFSDYASRIIHPLSRVLSTSQELRPVCMDTLAALVYQLGTDYTIFIPMIAKILSKYKIVNQRYDLLVSRLLKNEPMPQEVGVEGDDGLNDMFPEEELSAETGAPKKLPVNQNKLKKAWEASQRSTKDDWAEWIRRFSVELLKESPSHALRACSSLATVFYPLARELFNAGFVSCWTELYDQFQDELVSSVETALKSPNVPPEILQTILNLAEFMEHDEKPLPIPIKTLASYSTKCHAHAKALHYKEHEFHTAPSTQIIEALISINNQLQQPDAAIGILKYAQENHNLELKESWYEKLHRWEDALNAYESKQLEDPLNFDYTLGRMRCLHALGDWERLSQLAHEKWLISNEENRKVIAPLGAAASWGLKQWESMEEYSAVLKEDSPDGAFFRAILAIYRNQFYKAREYIDKTRDLLDTELTALVGESYSRSYNVVVRVQMLAELEEIIRYKQISDNPEGRKLIQSMWMKRLSGCQRNVEVWQRILKVRALVISPNDNEFMWIKFSNLCRKSGRMNLALKTFTNLYGQELDKVDQTTWNMKPFVTYSYLKYMWDAGNKQLALNNLSQFTNLLSQELSETLDSEVVVSVGEKIESKQHLLARCYHKLGSWNGVLSESNKGGVGVHEIDCFLSATKLDRNWYKAWHSWALANFEVISQHERSTTKPELSVISIHAVPAIQGFFRSIALSSGNSLQDTLRLLTLWFKYGNDNDVNNAISDGFNNVSIDTWLQVIPQLIARIHSPLAQVRDLIHKLLSEVGKQHPQALIYPLTVAAKSQSSSRRASAQAILDKMKIYYSNLVEQAQMVSEELIRVAILWHEMWHEGLEEASRMYFGDRNVEGMFAVLEPLHKILEKGPSTLREISFNQMFGRDLQEAHEWCKKYKRTGNGKDLSQAWDLYYMVFRKINKQLPQLTTLEFQYVSPKLLQASQLELAVPGTYKSGEPVVMIAGFVPTVNVITSKQRPRKLTIKGSDGKDYQYLLKGHEDLRQDERVMQLFGLVNALLETDPETFKRHLSIHRYPVIPLAPNSGLIGWVPHCDTLHALIRDYRESRKILLNIEHRLMLQMAPDYDHLTLIQKVEVFKAALENTTGQDLYKVLWLKSKNSEAWLDRRTNYTRSLAVMSMVGYILGLGDRHPSNLMLDRFTGKVIHIDFGDCFEVAMQRDKFPEKIPFRLTRMLINAMEVSGIEGNFRITCENVMRVLRDNKESLMAVLEAFVHDPLINWRLLTHNNAPSPIQGDMRSKDKENSLEYSSSRKVRTEIELDSDIQAETNQPEALNSRAVAVTNRVSNKLTGRDFKQNEILDVPSQVERLIQQATSHENLCQCYIGWCPFW